MEIPSEIDNIGSTMYLELNLRVGKYGEQVSFLARCIRANDLRLMCELDQLVVDGAVRVPVASTDYPVGCDTVACIE